MAESDYKLGIDERKLTLLGTFDLGESATLLLGAFRSANDKVGVCCGFD